MLTRLVTWTESMRLEEERIGRERRLVEQRRQMMTAIEAATAAERRAYHLLLDHLDEQQKQSLATNRYFEITSQHGNRYRIMYGDSLNVILLGKNGRWVRSYCALPHDVPIPDTMLAQMILLKCEEDYFLSVAHSVER